MVNSAIEFSVCLSGTMVLVLYLTTLAYAMWAIDKFMKKPRSTGCLLVGPVEVNFDESSEGDESSSSAETADTAEPAEEPETAGEGEDAPLAADEE